MNNEGAYNAMPVVVDDTSNDLMSMDYDNILMVAERADKMVDALNKMMNAAVKITNARDWVLIGGTPYLQESGATKVARLFGISWKILEQHQEIDKEGYPTYFYRMEFRMGGNTIEAEGSRAAKDEFFSGRDKKKSPDDIDIRDVRMSAYTNCINNGIKRMLPGLRNIDLQTLEDNGIHVKKGYTFKEGTKGGKTAKEASEGLVCIHCGAGITQAEASYSESKYGQRLCRSCQKLAADGGLEDANS